jgi:hypothetical protein
MRLPREINSSRIMTILTESDGWRYASSRPIPKAGSLFVTRIRGRDARDTNSKVFHRQYDFGASLGKAMLRVVVRYKKKWVVGRTAGTIITAYAANGPKAGEVLIWPQ